MKATLFLKIFTSSGSRQIIEDYFAHPSRFLYILHRTFECSLRVNSICECFSHSARVHAIPLLFMLSILLTIEPSHLL